MKADSPEPGTRKIVKEAVRRSVEATNEDFKSSPRKSRKLGEDPGSVKSAVLSDIFHEGIHAFLEILEIPDSGGVRNTPVRVLRALREMCGGYRKDPKEILSVRFASDFDQMIVVRGIRFTSLCEHHLLPFVGEAVVGYLPENEVVGLSKIPRLVEAFAMRLQIQERLTKQIADSIMEELTPKGCGVVIRAKHECMGCRGARQPDAEMITSTMEGAFRTEAAARAEFFRLAEERSSR